MEVFPLSPTGIPQGKSVAHHTRQAKLRSVIAKRAGFFKIALLSLVSILAILSWKEWESSIYEAYETNHQTIVKTLQSWKAKDFELAADYYANGNSIGATEIVSQHYKVNPNDTKLALLYAQMLTADGYLHVSRYVLNSVYISADKKNKGETAFLMAITYLREENYNSCNNWLNKVPRQSSQFKQAQQLLFKIKPFVSNRREAN